MTSEEAGSRADMPWMKDINGTLLGVVRSGVKKIASLFSGFLIFGNWHVFTKPTHRFAWTTHGFTKLSTFVCSTQCWERQRPRFNYQHSHKKHTCQGFFSRKKKSNKITVDSTRPGKLPGPCPVEDCPPRVWQWTRPIPPPFSDLRPPGLNLQRKISGQKDLSVFWNIILAPIGRFLHLCHVSLLQVFCPGKSSLMVFLNRKKFICRDMLASQKGRQENCDLGLGRFFRFVIVFHFRSIVTLKTRAWILICSNKIYKKLLKRTQKLIFCDVFNLYKCVVQCIVFFPYN
jgi:hypothetical protein